MVNKNLYLVEISSSTNSATPISTSPFDMLGSGSKTSVYYVMGNDYDDVERKSLLYHSMNLPKVPLMDSMGSLNISNVDEDSTYIVKSIKLVSEKVIM